MATHCGVCVALDGNQHEALRSWMHLASVSTHVQGLCVHWRHKETSYPQACCVLQVSVIQRSRPRDSTSLSTVSKSNWSASHHSSTVSGPAAAHANTVTKEAWQCIVCPMCPGDPRLRSHQMSFNTCIKERKPEMIFLGSTLFNNCLLSLIE